MGVSIDRQIAQYPGIGPLALTLTSSITTTPEIAMASFAGGCIYLPASSAITALAFYGSPFLTGMWPKGYNQAAGLSAPANTYYQLYNSSGAQILSPTVTTPGQVWAIPADCFAFVGLKIVITGASSAPVELSLKG